MTALMRLGRFETPNVTVLKPAEPSTTTMEPPDVRYAKSGDVAIAFEAIGAGPPDIVMVRGFAGDILSVWEQPRMVRFIKGLAGLGKVLLVDKRGTGLSDRVQGVPTLETRMDDLRAVMDEAGSHQALLWTAQEGARLATLFAATYPERVLGLVLFDPTSKGRQTPDYPWAMSDEEWTIWLTRIRQRWGRTEFLDELLEEWSPGERNDPAFRAWFHAHLRRGLSPGSALALFRMMRDSDVSDILHQVRVPTVVLFSPAERGPADYAAKRIPGARLVELPRLRSIYHWVDDGSHAIGLEETRRLLDSVSSTREAPRRSLATILFTDIVESTRQLATVGDRAWSDFLGRHHAQVRRQLDRFGGSEVDDAGDGIMVSFDGPARAVLCALAIGSELKSENVAVRSGLHTGECEISGNKIAGLAVHIAARVSNLAQPGEVLVTSTVKDLVAGSELRFRDRGTHPLKGVPGEWRLYAADAEATSR